MCVCMSVIHFVVASSFVALTNRHFMLAAVPGLSKAMTTTTAGGMLKLMNESGNLRFVSK